jgi:hypothetical protein
LKIRYESGYDIILYGGAPSWFPLGFPVTEVNQMPVFPRLTRQSIPKKLCSFDQKSRITNSQVTALHFYVSDSKFRNVLTSPEKYLNGFMQVGALLTPDITISKEMAQWARIRNTHLSRCLGAYFLARHFEVIPSLRWSEVSDLDFVLEGIPKNSIFSVGAYGSYRDKELRDTLEQGLVQAVARLKPQAIMIYGRLDKNFGNKIAKMTTVVNFEHPLSKEPKSIPAQSESDLFVA